MRDWLRLVTLLISVGSASAAAQVASGSYVGTGVSFSISGLGFAPKVVLVRDLGTFSRTGCVAVPTLPAGMAKQTGVGSDSRTQANRIVSLDTDGFTVGDGAGIEANVAGATYGWAASAAVPGAVYTNTFTGNGSATQTISGVGFSPVLIWIVPEAFRSETRRSRTSRVTSTTSSRGVVRARWSAATADQERAQSISMPARLRWEPSCRAGRTRLLCACLRSERPT